MVSLVIVSHSAQLAAGVRELALQMAQGQVSIAVAGGIDDPHHPIGTDAVKVYEAITSVIGGGGVLVLMDLGSALLSAETALEMLTAAEQAQVRLCAAPLVEGAMSAVVQAAAGGTLDEVYQEALGALAVKGEQMTGMGLVPALPADVLPHTADVEELHLTVPNRLGLHARPSARFVRTAARFAADIRVTKEGRTVTAKSINLVATLGVRQGDTITITASGEDADAALQALQALADENFGDLEAAEPMTPVRPVAPQVDGPLTAIPASPGIAIGPVVLYRPQLPPVKTITGADPDVEWSRLEVAVADAGRDIKSIFEQAVFQVGAAEAAIFEAHLLFLADPVLLEGVRERLQLRRINAEAAWQETISAHVAAYDALPDPYLQARAADLLDVGRRVLGHMMDVARPSLVLSQPSILVAVDLAPSDTAQLDPDLVLGICTELGGATSHSAILARALGIPAVVGAGGAAAALSADQMLALDGDTGQIWINPNYETLGDLQVKQQIWQGEQLRAKAAGQAAAVTQDGHHLKIDANIGSPHETGVALEYGAEGVGLFRTEFMFLDREAAPSEEEQLHAYRQAVGALGKRPLVIRTLDVGGDKPLPYLDLPAEENPFLGWRGIRFCLDRPELFIIQLRAILRASVDDAGQPTNLKVMFPMIGTLAELRAAKEMMAAVETELRLEGRPFDAHVEVGIMIEVPAAVAIADQLAAEVDFFSIGTNDLTQYAMAADRGNTRVAALADALQPAVLRLVQQTVQAGHAAGIWVGMCGELAGSALAAPVLVGLGLDELSMSAPAIPGVKEAVRRLTLAQAQDKATAVLQLESAAAINDYLLQAKDQAAP